MRLPTIHCSRARGGAVLALVMVTAVMVACGGGGGSDLSASGGGGASTSNSVAVVVNGGPSGVSAVNTLYTTVTLCAHGSTTECQTIQNVQIDTASSGFRVIASVLGQGVTTAQLTQVAGSNGNALLECTQFADGYSWGSVKLADVKVAGEVASNVPIQVIGDPTYPASTLAPANCVSNVDYEEDTVSTFGANGILGVQSFEADCGEDCPADGSAYNDCTANSCTGDSVAVASQVTNPVFLFAADNNGVQIQLPAASGNEASLSGTMIFGIGTQSNNALASTVTVYTLDPDYGTFNTEFAQTSYPFSIVDTGSSAYYFEDSAIPTCADTPADEPPLYCPASTESFTGSIQGDNGSIDSSVAFMVGNGDSLSMLASQGDAVLPSFAATAGSNTQTFDWGLPFFYGRNVYVGNEGATIGGQTGPLIAF
jgi:hypothetical protein